MSEPGPQEREEQLAVLRRRMGRALRRGDDARLRALAVVYEAAKRGHMEQAEDEHKARVRASRAQQQPVVPESWRLPFRKSPGALKRDRQRAGVPQLPPGGHLSPWRRSGSAMSETIWRA